MNEPMTAIALAGFALVGLTIALVAILKGWHGWLELKRLELSGLQGQSARSPAGDRIEMADLKERVRKLESIAACIDL
ncbi:hypothetical protein [Sphingosinicella rhizophila]|uniref:Phage shock protein B n=1 Tax=Sphingosinicella rhizophila TaxID=3050082 RepID=A0ABU3Q6B1_9SPHN|nr:hypothetical protein [Sphingosinicella sp. GR2756]MDT9598935.1 hypothetical protein [Sphingosinicella sp. GR2756]